MFNSKVEKWRMLSSYLYDYIIENNLEWPCMTCKWGPLVDKCDEYFRQKIYFSCRTDGTYNEVDNSWKKFACFLVVAVVGINLLMIDLDNFTLIDTPNYGISFDQELNSIFLQQNFKKCPNLTVKQILVHPGEINCIKKSAIDPKWVATHSDSPNVYIWNLDKHNNVPISKENIPAEIPELTLIGHTDMAPYALDWARTHNRIASGGRDTKLLVWDIEDYQTSLSSNIMLLNKRELNAINGIETTNVKINAKRELKGHTEAIEEVCFHPKNKDLLCSVGDDKKLIMSDIRLETTAFEMTNIHDDDINGVDWNLINDNLLATGSNDGNFSIIDIRMQKVMLKVMVGNKKSNVRVVKFANFADNILGVGADHLFIYDANKCLSGDNNPLFTHSGHRSGITDFDWNPYNNWSMISSSDNCDVNSTGGGSMHLFRPLDLIYMKEEDALDKMEMVLEPSNGSLNGI